MIVFDCVCWFKKIWDVFKMKICMDDKASDPRQLQYQTESSF